MTAPVRRPGAVTLAAAAAAAGQPGVSEVIAQAGEILAPVVGQVLVCAGLWAQIAATNPDQRGRCVTYLAGELHRALDATPEDLVAVVAELAVRLVEQSRPT